MKQQAFTTLFKLSLLVMLATTSAYSQTQSPMRANIPFDFTIGSKTLRAGKYILERVNRQTIQETVLIRSVDGKAVMLVRTTPTQSKSTPEQTRLIFNYYGEQYFLSNLITAGEDLGLAFPKSRLERALEQQFVGRDQANKATVALAR